MVLLNALIYIGWSFLNGSLLYFGVLTIKNPFTGNYDSFLYPVNDFLFFNDGEKINHTRIKPPKTTTPTVTLIDNSHTENVTFTTGFQTTAGTTEVQTTAATTEFQTTAATTGFQTTAATTGFQATTATTEVQTTAATTGFQTTAATTEFQNLSTTTSVPETTKDPTKPDYSLCGIRSPGRKRLDSLNNKISAEQDLAEKAYINGIIELKIIGGVDAADGEWPWAAHIFETANGPLNGGICGGSLISSKWILTAAHCFPTPTPDLYSVALGEHTRSETSGFEVFRTLKRIIPHPLFNLQTLKHDIALVELSKDVELTEFIRPACLVPEGTRTDANVSPTYAGTMCVAVGWGVLANKGKQSDILQHINLRIMERTLCLTFTEIHQQDYLPVHVLDDTSKFCAGGTVGEDTCNGDSGGPLACKHDDGRFYLHGVTSYGAKVCAQVNHPGIYTKVADYAKWIEKNTKIEIP